MTKRELAHAGRAGPNGAHSVGRRGQYSLPAMALVSGGAVLVQLGAAIARRVRKLGWADHAA